MVGDPGDMDGTESPAAFAPGMMIDHYRVIEKIGAGGMGDVYLAEDTKLHRRVALKFLSFQLCQDEEHREQFTREAQAAAQLNHPNIVTIHEVNEFETRPFYAMTHVEGQTLAQFSSRRILAIETIVNLGIQIAAALAAAHEHKITHRDLKPNNIIIDSSNNIHVLDFGLAVLGHPEAPQDPDETVTKLTSLGLAAGTIPYMAPEQLTGQSTGPRIDIFALGVILYEMSCGERPFSGGSSTELATSILRNTPQTVSQKRRDTPYDLARIISRCLHKDPDKRFQSAREIMNELTELRGLMEQGEAPIDIDKSTVTGRPSLIEAKFTLTADLVRQMNYKSPQMIGDGMSYLDNGIKSDLLVIFLHAMGLDQRQFAELLRMFPYRGIAPSLYGYDLHASQRHPLSLSDHSILLRALFRDLQHQLQPKHILLCGQSTGADHILHLIESPEGVGADIDGMLSFGCNTSLGSCLLSAKLVALTSGKEDDIIEAIREFGHSAGSLRDYLTVCEYMVTGLEKFVDDIEPLRAFAIGIVKPFESRGADQFPHWYRMAVERVPCTRFVFSTYELNDLNEILRRHLENNVLGDSFREDTIIREDVSHIKLADPELMLKHALAVIEQMRS